MGKLLPALLLGAGLLNAKNTYTSVVDNNRLAEDGSSLLQFRVVTTDDQNRNWTCLRLEFSLEFKLNVGGDDIISSMMNGTVPDSVSNCSTLQLNLLGSPSTNTVTLSFLEQTTEHGTSTTYLTSLYGRGISFDTVNGTATGEARINYVAEGSVPSNTSFVTPVEVNSRESSFRCYNGFATPELTNIAKDAENDSTLSFVFKQFRLERYLEYNENAVDLEDDSPWQRILSCDADISTVLPILVGCVLAGIVLVTLVGYFIARRRSQHAYEEL